MVRHKFKTITDNDKIETRVRAKDVGLSFVGFGFVLTGVA